MYRSKLQVAALPAMAVAVGLHVWRFTTDQRAHWFYPVVIALELFFVLAQFVVLRQLRVRSAGRAE